MFKAAVLILKFDAQTKKFIDKYFDILFIAFVVILVLGFVVVKLVL
jgi:hypothetical protein